MTRETLKPKVISQGHSVCTDLSVSKFTNFVYIRRNIKVTILHVIHCMRCTVDFVFIVTFPIECLVDPINFYWKKRINPSICPSMFISEVHS